MKTSFDIGVVEIESCIVLKKKFVTKKFSHCNVLSPNKSF
jgi:hypothetical protein